MTTEGQSTTRRFPSDSGKPAEFRSCDSGGATYHFCPVCGSTVYWELAIAPAFLGVAVGTFADPTFPPPMIAGFAAYGAEWAMNVSAFRCREGTMTTTEHHTAGHERDDDGTS
jgi:hypothetical protein